MSPIAPRESNPPEIALVLKGYPRLSETFIAQEILGLEQRGVAIEIVSLRHPYDPSIHPIHEQIKASVRYLPEYLYQEPLRVLRAWWQVRRWPRYRTLWSLWISDLRRDWTREPRAPLRPGLGVRRRNAGEHPFGLRPLSAHAGIRRPLCRAPERPALQHVPPTPRTSGHRRIGKFEKSSKTVAGSPPAPGSIGSICPVSHPTPKFS